MKGQLEGSKGQLEWSEDQPAGSGGRPAGSEGQPEAGQTDVWMDGRTKFLPILQNFVLCRGHCLKTNPEPQLKQSEGLLDGSECWLEGCEGQPARSEGQS